MSNQFIIFNVLDEYFGVEITQVREIIKPPKIVKVPNTLDYIEGIMNLRGKVHTIFNLRKKFHFQYASFTDDTKIIVVNVKSLLVGFIVDGVSEILRVAEEDIEEAPPTISAISEKYLTGVAKVGEKIIMILDLEKIVSDNDHEHIQELISHNSDV